MGRSPKPMPSTLQQASGHVLVQAYLAAEAENAVPVDQLVVTAGRKPPPLLVPKAAAIRLAVRKGFVPGDCAPAAK
jgi:hypothetical protein